MNFEAIAKAAIARLPVLLPIWLPQGRVRGREYVCAGIHGGKGESMSVNMETGIWADFSTTDTKGGDPISLLARIRGCSQSEAAKELDDIAALKLNGHTSHTYRDAPFEMKRPPNVTFKPVAFRHSRLGTPDDIWVYRDADGPLNVVARYNPPGERKQIIPWSFNGDEWIAKALPRPRPLYGLDRLARMKPDLPVLIAEGEKATDAAQNYWESRPCMTWPGGTGGAKHADWKPLAGRDVIIWPDADAPGREAANTIAEILLKLECKVRVVNTSMFADGWDLADAEQAGMKVTELVAMIKAATIMKLPNEATLSEPIPSTAQAEETRGPAIEAETLAATERHQENAIISLVSLVITDSDIANGKRLESRHGRDLKFTPERGWHVWNGRQWKPDDKGVQTQELAKETALSIFDEIRDAPARDARMQHAKRSQSKGSVEAMIWLARSERGIPARVTDFDKDIWSFNVANGAIDLRTGKLRPHRREDLISNIADFHYDPEAECKLWDKFLRRILDRNEELYAYMRRFAGYLLAGDVSDQSLHFLYGEGSNGKSTFCEVLIRLLGEYSITVSPDLIMQKRHAGIPNDVARLRGKRAAFMNETSQGSRFDEAKLKDLTGGDTLTARFLHQEFFDFEPTHRLVIRGNYKPAINGTDEGIWRRLRLVPFTVTIPDVEKDGQLKAKLLAELPGILNWAVRGCLEWQANGLNPPAIITEAVQAYRQHSDTLGRFIEEHCEVRKLAQVKSSSFFKRYQEFAETAGERWLQLKDLPNEMQRRGFTWKRTKAGGIFEGIELQIPNFD